jgi:hypothetical protein
VRHVRSILVGVLIASCSWGTAGAAPPTAPPADASTTVVSESLGPSVPVFEAPPPIVDPIVASSPLVVVPAGCTAPPGPIAVFLGTLTDSDATTARFAVQQIRAGSLDGYAVGTIVDVHYDDDIRFLHTGQPYLVGVASDPLTRVLRSKVRVPPQLFGGDAVIGVNDTNVRCPRVEDGVKTLLADGTGVDTGVLTPLKTAKKAMFKAVLKPLSIAFGVLVMLAAIKLLIFAMVRAARESDVDDTAPPFEMPRDRQHTDDDTILTGSRTGGGGP